MAERESTNPKDAIGRSKPSLHLIPSAALIHEAVVMGLGAKKYGPYNWRGKDVSAVVYISAALRHIFQYLDREDVDPESNASHLGHARACLGILLDAMELNKLVDDRPPKGPAADLLKRFTLTNYEKPKPTDPELVSNDPLFSNRDPILGSSNPGSYDSVLD